MGNADSLKLVQHGESRRESTNRRSQGGRLVACFLLVPSDAEAHLALLEQLVATSEGAVTLPSLLGSPPHGLEPSNDRWLAHPEAPKRLGVSIGTLYRYASHHRIEYNKIAGRLEYRQSALEKLKQDQVHPARFPLGGGGMLRSALSSGK